MIRLVHADDAPSLCSIYNPYILGTTITFEEQPVAPEEMRRRILDVSAQLPWLVYLAGPRIVGYAYASKWKARSAYRHSVESTVYVDSSYHRQGIGRTLYGELLRRLKEQGLHQVIGGIPLPNEGSQRLHESLGFRKVAQFESVGFKFGRWLDVGYWQRAV